MKKFGLRRKSSTYISDEPPGKPKEYRKAAVDGLVALLTLGRQSTDGVAVANGILGGLLWVAETAQVIHMIVVISSALT